MSAAKDQIPLELDRYDDAVLSASSIFPNAGLHNAASACAGAHPRAIQYLTQAPVLVISGLAIGHRRVVSWYQMRMTGPCERGELLRDVMKIFGLPFPLRKLKGYALSNTAVPVIQKLSLLDATVLGRIIPEKPGAQRRWIGELAKWIEAHKTMCRFHPIAPELHFQWAAENILKAATGERRTVADFAFRSGQPFNEAWGWKRAHEEAELWHDTLTTDAELRRIKIPATMRIDHATHADDLEYGDYRFVALRTPAEIIAEGRKMRHCVASYVQQVMAGGCHIVSVRKSGERIATMELNKVGQMVQLKGKYNAKPSAETFLNCSAYVAAETLPKLSAFTANRAKRMSA
jgi:hypothetical protein